MDSNSTPLEPNQEYIKQLEKKRQELQERKEAVLQEAERKAKEALLHAELAADEVLRKSAVKIFNVCKKGTIGLLQSGKLEDSIAQSPNLRKMKYTYLHRHALLDLASRYGIDSMPFQFHDVDKYFLYLWLQESETREKHRCLNEHHRYTDMALMDKNELLEIMLDWESARFSKPDKPYNAYDTMMNWMPASVEPHMTPLLQEYGLYHHTDGPCINNVMYKIKAAAVTPKMIAAEIQAALNANLTFT